MNICPTINSLAENGILCTQARAHGCPSQMTFPGIMTSTLPLDFGGYDRGILDRPATLAGAMQCRGLHTVGLNPSPWLGFCNGYDRGFDEFYELFDLEIFWQTFSTVYFKFYRDLWERGVMSDQEYHRTLGHQLEAYLKDMARQCETKQRELVEKKFPFHLTLHRFDFPAMRMAIMALLDRFRKDPDAFIGNITKNGLTHDVVSFALNKSGRNSFMTALVKGVDHFLKLFFVQMWRYEYSVPASYLAEQVISVTGANQARPFFLWTHFLDVHDSTYIAGRVGLPPNYLTLGMRRLLDRKNSAKAVQTFSLRFIDRQIRKIFVGLESQGLLDSTLIVISGDHGSHFQGAERMAGNLFDDVLHVPLIFYNPNLKSRRICEPHGLLDVAPTILDLLGKEPCPEFMGRSLLQPSDPDEPVILESLGPGPCDLRYKAIKISVVQGKYKLIWREPGYENTCPPGENYLFDLQADPGEGYNLYADPQYANILSSLETIVTDRVAKLRKRHHENGHADGR